MKKVILFILFAYVLISCKTMDPIYLQKDLRDAQLTGRIVSEEGLPIDGVRVRLTGSRETKSDVNGYFLFRYLSYGKYNIAFEKEGYLKADLQINYSFKNRKMNFFSVKMFSLNYLVKEGFEYLKEKKYEKTGEIIDKLETINPEEEVVLYLKAMFNYIKEIYPQSLILLEKLKEMDRKNIFYQLTLVEVYGKLELYQKQAQLSFYIGSTEPKEYYRYFKIAADVYKDKLGNIVESEKAMILYNEYQKKYGNK